MPVLSNERSPMQFRHFRRIYGRLCGDVYRRVVVRIAGEPTLQTKKLGLAFAIAFLTVTALGAGAARVAGIDFHNGHSIELTFVGDKTPQLCKSPSTHLGPLLFAEPSPVADMCQIFQRDSSAGVFGAKHECFADNVILVTAESCLLVSNAFHGTANIPASSALAAHFTTHRTADGVILLPDTLDVLAGNALPVAGGNNLLYSQVHTDKLLNFDGCCIGQVDGTKQVKLSGSVHQVTLPFDSIKPRLLVFPVNHRNNLPADQRQQTHFVQPLKTHQPFIVSHSTKRLERRAPRLISTKALNGLTNGTDGHLAGQTKLFSQFSVAANVNARLAEYVGIEPHFGGMGGCCVKRPHGVQQQSRLLGVGQQLDLQCQFHNIKYTTKLLLSQEGGGDSSVS